MESGNPRQMRGASHLLDKSAADVKALLMDENKFGVKEAQIIVSGATLYAQIPKGSGIEAVKQAEEKFHDNCRTANAAFVAVAYDEDDYIASKRHALAEYEIRRAEKFISWKLQNLPDKMLENERDNTSDNKFGYRRMTDEDYKKNKTPKRCPRCRLRDPIYHVTSKNGEQQYLCTPCAKREKMSGERKYYLRKKCGDSNKFNYDYDINTMSDLAEDGRVALLYADVNNLGGQEPQLSFCADKDYHARVETAVKDAVHTAIEQAMERKGLKKNGQLISKFEIIALSGDDVCLLLPGDVALLAAKTIVDEFDQNVAKNKLDLTISVAACVANDTTAIAYMHSIVEKALKAAKTCAREEGQSVVNLSFFEQPSDLFPMTTTELAKFVDLMGESSSTSSSSLHNISTACHALLEEEFELFFNYHLSREINSNSQSILKCIHKEYAGKKPWPDVVAWSSQKLGKGGETR